MSFLVKDGKILTLNGKTIAVNTSASVTAPGGWQGTPFSINGGIVSKICFNIEMTPEEFVSIVDKTIDELAEPMGMPTNEIGLPVFLTDDDSVFCGLALYEGVYTLQMAVDGRNYTYFVYSKDANAHQTLIDTYGFIGWRPSLQEINGVIETKNIETMEMSLILPPSYLSLIEKAFENVSAIISMTPFVQTQAETIQLSGDYDGSTIAIDVSAKWNDGTAVPNTGYIEKVYINTGLSLNEVMQILAILDGENGYLVLSASQTDREMMNYPFLYAGYNPTEGILTIYGKSATDSGVVAMLDNSGWNPNFNGEFIVNHEVYSKFTDTNKEHPDANAFFTKLFSITPFTKTEGNKIDVRELLDNRKLPLTINVKGASGGASGVKKLDFTKDYNLTLDDGTQVTTFGYQATDEELELLKKFIKNENDTNGLNGTINCVINYGRPMTLANSLNGCADFTLNNDEKLTGFEVAVNMAADVNFGIDDNNYIYLSAIATIDVYEYPKFEVSDNLIADFINMVTSISISIPTL